MIKTKNNEDLGDEEEYEVQGEDEDNYQDVHFQNQYQKHIKNHFQNQDLDNYEDHYDAY